ncbi:MAG: hypothetical protein KY464_12195 [Gemmatimonadetes bacterium]|nr:hypothetical protein [Gemmatimonadota bacterium]
MSAREPALHAPASRALPEHPVWREIAPELAPSDFRHPEQMDAAFLRRLSAARRRAGVPFRILSDHRPPERNEAAGGARRSAHLEVPCRAVDLRVETNEERFRVLAALLAVGFTRIGVYPAREDGAGSLHVDASASNPSPRVWTHA